MAAVQLTTQRAEHRGSCSSSAGQRSLPESRPAQVSELQQMLHMPASPSLLHGWAKLQGTSGLSRGS